ncbi:TetR/AcrR family transcriptional regulator [Gulosibacter chungangensis]|uniref:TetR family transcriptional regulator n=1 Tax=Gulosibacter chungangensis TaxID=979746 RepID=A0A7J5BCL6_9MICO|nr:TetR/AcrR family transcriptional regulator [Gulosibacter chungangensis]KAB1643947.1 TetR family transcriptional regulator [Gulosibacter chungangensis]
MTKTRGRGRPPVTTREAVEDVAMTLFEQRGIENTTVVDIAEACEMSKTSFFRYFSSKNEILWGPFETMVQRMDETLRTMPEDRPIMEALREVIRDQVEIEAQRAEAWIRRFKFQNTEEQRPLSLVNWGRWEGVVLEFVRERSHAPDRNLIPFTVAGALRGAMRAFLRNWGLSGNTDVTNLLPDFDEQLDPVFSGLAVYVGRIPNGRV